MTGEGADGPVPVRDLIRQIHEEPESAAREEASPVPAAPEHVFRVEDETWVVRVAGAGAYGTGRLGGARLIAIHFFLETDLDTPLREALIPAGRFPGLGSPELRDLLERATPIELES